MQMIHIVFPALILVGAFWLWAFVSTMITSRRNSNSHDAFHPSIRTDANAMEMIDEYRRRYSSGPIGEWVDCYTETMGIGFSGLTGIFAKATFRADGTGRLDQKYASIHFVWHPVSDRVIDVRCVKHLINDDDEPENDIAEDESWQRMEFDFVVPTFLQHPAICDINEAVVCGLRDGAIDVEHDLSFLKCLDPTAQGVLKRFGH